jgi:hypothetical protein
MKLNNKQKKKILKFINFLEGEVTPFTIKCEAIIAIAAIIALLLNVIFINVIFVGK